MLLKTLLECFGVQHHNKKYVGVKICIAYYGLGNKKYRYKLLFQTTLHYQICYYP